MSPKPTQTGDLLKLEATKEQSLSIAIFGSYKGSTKVCINVNVGMCPSLYT